MLQIDELGDAESILRNRLYLRETAQRLIRRGIVTQDHGWDGWLGRYQKALAEAASLSNANEQRKQLSATGTGTLVASWIGRSADAIQRRTSP